MSRTGGKESNQDALNDQISTLKVEVGKAPFVLSHLGKKVVSASLHFWCIILGRNKVKLLPGPIFISGDL